MVGLSDSLKGFDIYIAEHNVYLTKEKQLNYISDIYENKKIYFQNKMSLYILTL